MCAKLQCAPDNLILWYENYGDIQGGTITSQITSTRSDKVGDGGTEVRLLNA